MPNADDRPEHGDGPSEEGRRAEKAGSPDERGAGAASDGGPEVDGQAAPVDVDGPAEAEQPAGSGGSGEEGAEGVSADKVSEEVSEAEEASETESDRAAGRAQADEPEEDRSAAQGPPGQTAPAATSSLDKDVTEPRPTPQEPMGRPVHEQPGAAQPGYGQQGYAQPGYGEPGYAGPGYGPVGYGANYGTGYGPAHLPPGPGFPGHSGAAPRPGIVPLRPLSTGEILAGALGYVRANPLLTLGVSAAVMVITQLLQLVLQFALPQLGPDALAAGRGGELVALVLVQLLISLAGIVLGALLTGLLLVVLSRAVLGQRIEPRPAWEALAPRLVGLIGVTLLVGLALVGIVLVGMLPIAIAVAADGGAGSVMAASLLLVAAFVGVAYLAVLWALAPAAYVLEPIGVVAALGRSARLVRGAWWPTFGVLVLAGILVAVPMIVLMGLVGGFSLAPAAGATIGSAIAVVVVGTIATPFATGVSGLLYIDQRIRRERFDVDLARAAGTHDSVG